MVVGSVVVVIGVVTSAVVSAVVVTVVAVLDTVGTASDVPIMAIEATVALGCFLEDCAVCVS